MLIFLKAADKVPEKGPYFSARNFWKFSIFK